VYGQAHAQEQGRPVAGAPVVGESGPGGIAVPSCTGPLGSTTSGTEAEPVCGEQIPADRWYGRAEYLIWWLREGRVPGVLTTSSPAFQGIPGRGDTKVIYGDDRLPTRHDDRFVGTRFALGYWLDEGHTLGIEAGGFFLERDSTYFKAVSNGDTLLARPYINALDGSPASEIIAGPGPEGVRNGGFNGYSRVELFGQEVNFVVPLTRGACFRLDLLAGARFLQMRDRTDLTATGRLLPDQSTLFGLTDHYRADDQFYGGQVGLRGEYTLGRWFVNLHGKAALGGTEQTVRAFGDRTFQTPTTKVVQPYGLTVQPSNTGTFHNADIDFVSEVGINAGYRLTRHLDLFAGYTFLAWLNPVRSGDQVDLVVNPNQGTGPPGGPARPAIPFREDFFWAQGVNVGLDLHW
jgi:hypothetical protein